MPETHCAARRTPLRRRLLLAIAAAVATLALLEGALWLCWPLPPPPAGRLHRFLPSWNALGNARHPLRADPGPLAGVTPGAFDNPVNSFGYLYDEARQRRASADEVRVAVVGGSTVECFMLAPDKRWSAVLEQRLRTALQRPVTVLNLGVSAMDTRTHLATTSHVVTDLDVDVCVFMIGTNDLGTITSTHHPMLLHDAFHPAPRWTRVLKDLWQHTQIARHLQRLGDRPIAPRGTPYFQAEAARQASLPMLPEDVQATVPGLAHYERNVVSLAGLCREHGIAVLFTTQPCMFPAAPTPDQLRVYWGCHTGTHQIAATNFRALLAAVNAHLLQACARRGYPCVDLANEVPPGLGWFYDQVHFNEAGARRVGEALVEPVRALLR